jgi:hypothetical protein
MCKIYDGLVGRTVTRFTDLAIFVEQLFRRRLGRYSSPATRAASTHSLMSALVKSRHLRCKKSCPLYPRKRTFAAHLGMSAKGKKRPRKNIGHAARRRRHDQRNRLVGIVLTMGAPEAMLNQTAAAARIAISSLHPPPASPQKKPARSKDRGPKLTAHSDTLNTRSGLFSVLTFLRIIEMVRPVVHQPGGVAQCCRLPVWGEFSHDVDRRTGKMVCQH